MGMSPIMSVVAMSTAALADQKANWFWSVFIQKASMKEDSRTRLKHCPDAEFQGVGILHWKAIQTNAMTSQRMISPRVPLTVARLKLGSLGRARTSKNCNAASLDK